MRGFIFRILLTSQFANKFICLVHQLSGYMIVIKTLSGRGIIFSSSQILFLGI